MATDFASKPRPTKLYTIQLSLLQIWVKSVSDFSSFHDQNEKKRKNQKNMYMYMYMYM